jgi:adenylyltransferase/sulfurtransferase
MSFEFVTLKKNPNCKVCGTHPEITALIDYDEFCGVPGIMHAESVEEAEWDISARELSILMKTDRPPCLVDVREAHELIISSLPGAVNIPLGEMAGRLTELDSAQELVLICKSGTRSARALELLLSAGFRKVKNLKGGINAWAQDVDSRLPVY